MLVSQQLARTDKRARDVFVYNNSELSAFILRNGSLIKHKVTLFIRNFNVVKLMVVKILCSVSTIIFWM